MRIGILEDELTQLELYRQWFGDAGIQFDCFTHAREFQEAVSRQPYDILVIDWMVPDGDGVDVVAWIRQNQGWDIPVIFITARDAEPDIVAAIQAGADDYVVKPPKQRELMARIVALTRRTRVMPQLDFGDYKINNDKRCIEVQGQPVDLTNKEFELACYMLQSPGVLLSRTALLETLWGLNSDIDTRTVDTHVSRIRRKLEIGAKHGWQIYPVYGCGYRVEKVAKTSD